MNPPDGRPTILRLVLLVSLATCLPVLLLCAFQVQRAYSRDQQVLADQVRMWRDVASEQLENYADEAERVLRVMASNASTNRIRVPNFERVARGVVQLRDLGQTLVWLDAGNRVVASTDPLIPTNSVPDWASVVRNRDGFEIWGGVRVREGVWRVPASIPYQPLGETKGQVLVLLGDPQNELQSRIGSSWPKSGQGLVVMALDPNGYVAVHSTDPEKFVGSALPGYEAFARRVDAGEVQGLTPGFDGRPRLFSATRIGETRWILRSSVDYGEVQERLWERIRRSLLLLGLTGVVAVGASRWLAGLIARPANALAGAARELSAGVEGRPLEEEGPREIAETARAFNEMVLQRRDARRRLEESEGRFRRLFENMSSGFALVEVSGSGEPVVDYRFVEANRAFESLLRRQPGSLVGRDAREALGTTEPLWIAPIGAVSGSGESARFEAFLPDLGRHLEVTAFPASSKRVGLLVHDVTERVRGREAMDAVHRRYQNLLDSIGGIVWDSSPDGDLTYVSPQAERILGHPVSRWMDGSRAWETLLHASDRQRVSSVLREAIYEGRVLSLDFRMVHADGRTVWLRNLVTPVREADGTVRRLGVMFDITEQKRAEERLRENERMLELALEGADLGFWHLDLADRGARFSSRWITMLGFEPAGFQHSLGAWEALVHPEDLASFRAAMKAHFVDGSRTSYESVHRLRNASGGWAWVASRGRVVERAADGRPLRAAGTHLDVTATRVAAEERAALERKIQETQKLESLGVLAGGIAHDFNNLLTGILGNASLARLTLPSTSPGLDYVAEVEKAAERAAHLCRQMLAYSGRGRFVVQRIDVNPVIEDMAHLLAISIGKGVILRQNLARQLPPIEVDVTQFRQVLMNLVINASEAIGERSGVIAISTGAVRVDATYLQAVTHTPEAHPGDYLYVEVGDNGCGMDAETLSRIFDPFFTTKFTGRGLGLAAVLGIVRGHRGAIKVYSEPGRGTTFKLLFPVADGVASPLLLRPAPEPLWRSGGEVLVVDDEETLRTLVARMLERLGMTAVLCGDPRDAVEVFEKAPARFEVVLLDLTMPHLGGEEVFRRLRTVRPDVPVVLMSGFTEEDAVSRFAGKGLAGFLQKPFGPADLAEALQRVLKSSKPSPEKAG